MKKGIALNETISEKTEADSASGTLIFYSVWDALATAAPTGSTVTLIGSDIADSVLRAGYRTVERNADVVIARGGEREFAEARKISDGAKLIFAPTHGFSAAATSAYRMQSGAFAVMREGVSPFAAVFDKTDIDRNLASVFGEIVSLDLCAFDLAFSEYMQGKQISSDVIERVARLVTDTTEALAPVVKNRAEAQAILTDAGVAAAKITADRPELLHFSGASQTAEALRMLYAAEDRALGMRGETEMILSFYITDFYIKNLTSASISFPPDNNKRIDSVCEYFNVDVRKACAFVSPVYPPLKLRLCEYRRDEFKREEAKLLGAVIQRQNAAKSVFKRLYEDDGYAARSLVDKTDIAICLALAPDVFAADTMLSFLKQTGKLDEYLI